jgi:uncharacterized membrane protein YfhO
VWFNRVDDLTAPMLSMMNVRYAMVKESDDVPDGWREVARERGLAKLLENAHALPRAFVPRHVRLGTPHALVIPEMRGESDFGERAWIESNSSPHEEENGPGVATPVEAGAPLRNEWSTVFSRSGWVVISQTNLRGWRAYVDGRPLSVARANHAFIAVYVPKGRHTLRLAFRPRSFVVGRNVSVITLLAIALIAFVQRRRTIGLSSSSRA